MPMVQKRVKCYSKINKPWNTWKFIKNTMHADYNYKQNLTEISINSSTTTDSNIISNKCNDYFVNVGPNLAKIFHK